MKTTITMGEDKRGHGNRKHLQILLGRYRGELFSSLMKKKGIKPSAWIREMIYKYLETELPAETYKNAADKDDEDWQQTVQNRLEGRALSKLLNSIRK